MPDLTPWAFRLTWAWWLAVCALGVLGLVPRIEQSPTYQAGLLVLCAVPLVALVVCGVRGYLWRRALAHLSTRR